MLGYEFSTEFKSGHSNWVVDALSRYSSEEEDAFLAVISFLTLLWLQELKMAYLTDDVVQQHFKTLQQDPSAVSLFSVKHEVLFIKERIYIPYCKQFKAKVLEFVH